MKKRGSSILATPIMISISMISLIMLTMLIVNLIMPFTIYQKLDNIATKYIFVIEKFGYLTESEKNNLLSDLNQEGIDSNYIKLEYPKKKEPYGNLITLKISYEYAYNIINFEINKKEKTIISVTKNSFSKIY